jgi:hypothetical protein
MLEQARAGQARQVPPSPERPPARQVPVLEPLRQARPAAEGPGPRLPGAPPALPLPPVPLRTRDEPRLREPPSREASPRRGPRGVSRQWPALPEQRAGRAPDEAGRPQRPAPGAAEEQSSEARVSLLPQPAQARAEARALRGPRAQGALGLAPRRRQASAAPGAPCAHALPAAAARAIAERYLRACVPATSQSWASLRPQPSTPCRCRRARAECARARARLRPSRSSSSASFSPSRQPGSEHPEFPCS